MHRHIVSWCSMVYLSSTRISRRRCRKLECRHTCFSRKSSVAVQYAISPGRSRKCPKPRMPVGIAQNGLSRTHLCSCLCPRYLLLHLHCGVIGKADLESLTQDSVCMRVPARQCPQPACPGTACCLGRSTGSAPPPSDGWQLSTSQCFHCLEPPLHSLLCRSGQVK